MISRSWCGAIDADGFGITPVQARREFFPGRSAIMGDSNAMTVGEVDGARVGRIDGQDRAAR